MRFFRLSATALIVGFMLTILTPGFASASEQSETTDSTTTTTVADEAADTETGTDEASESDQTTDAESNSESDESNNDNEPTDTEESSETATETTTPDTEIIEIPDYCKGDGLEYDPETGNCHSESFTHGITCVNGNILYTLTFKRDFDYSNTLLTLPDGKKLYPAFTPDSLSHTETIADDIDGSINFAWAFGWEGGTQYLAPIEVTVDMCEPKTEPEPEGELPDDAPNIERDTSATATSTDFVCREDGSYSSASITVENGPTYQYFELRLEGNSVQGLDIAVQDAFTFTVTTPGVYQVISQYNGALLFGEEQAIELTEPDCPQPEVILEIPADEAPTELPQEPADECDHTAVETGDSLACTGVGMSLLKWGLSILGAGLVLLKISKLIEGGSGKDDSLSNQRARFSLSGIREQLSWQPVDKSLEAVRDGLGLNGESTKPRRRLTDRELAAGLQEVERYNGENATEPNFGL